MSQIEIVLTTDDSWFSRLARWLGAEWTHAMLRVFDYEQFGTFGNMPLPADAIIEGASFIGIGDYFLIKTYRIIEATMRHGVAEGPWNPEKYTRWAVYNTKKPLTVVQKDMILGYARGNVGKSYAYDKLILLLPRLLRRFLNRLYETHRKQHIYLLGLSSVPLIMRTHICSSLVDDCFAYAGLDLVPDIDTPWVLPDDIASSPLLELAPPDGAIEW